MLEYLTIEHLTTKDLTRVFSKIHISTDRFYNGSPCWEWTGTKNSGYGAVSWKGKMLTTHRFFYAWLVAPVPPYISGESNIEIDHLCRNRACANPAHLELVPHKINTHRGTSFSAIYAQMSACKNGHPFSEENTRFTARQRVCRECERAAGMRKRKTEANKEWNRRYLKKPERLAYIAKWKREKRAKNKANIS